MFVSTAQLAKIAAKAALKKQTISEYVNSLILEAADSSERSAAIEEAVEYLETLPKAIEQSTMSGKAIEVPVGTFFRMVKLAARLRELFPDDRAAVAEFEAGQDRVRSAFAAMARNAPADARRRFEATSA